YEGALNPESIAQTRQRFGPAYDYHRIEPRLVENLLIQSSLMDWLTVRAAERSLRFHVIGTGLLSALVWSGALAYPEVVRTAVRIGVRWDASLKALALEDLKKSGMAQTEENLGWRRFHRVRQIVEGRANLSLSVSPEDLPRVDGPSRPFWFSITGKDEPVRIETVQDVRMALEAMNLSSWSPDILKPPAHDQTADRVRGWLVSPMHPAASTCHWSVYNYLLATPDAASLFLDHIASRGPVTPLPIPSPVFERRSTVTSPSVRT
ncbi:MAG TPA: hypothetical protein VK210_17170, partial [Terriglobia bacterium]|nr:hypothetical protein [Terriglobia bacterium]